MGSNALAGLLGLGRDTAQGASNAAAGIVSGPVDLLAWLARKAGAPVGDAPVGGSEWMARQGLTAKPQNALAGMIGETGGNLLPFAHGARTANALIKAGDNLAAPTMAGPAAAQRGAIVYHGSPHKFDRFDASKIGTGEGAQAYGHGLYLAESPDVAQSYKQMADADPAFAAQATMDRMVGKGVDYGDAESILAIARRKWRPCGRAQRQKS